MQNSIQYFAPLGYAEGYALTTADASFAYSLYERGLDLGIQGHVAATGDGYLVELFGEETECDTALTLAMAGELLV
jgi:hypothetical protein